MRFDAFEIQSQILMDQSRFKALLAGKRAGKSEVAYIDDIIKADEQPGYNPFDIEPYQMAIVAPSWEMLETLVWPKFRIFAKQFESNFNAKHQIFYWNRNNTIIYSASAEKIKRIEGKKIRHIHLTEAFQMQEKVWLEALARVSDTKGSITIDGSLSPDFPNPTQHWIYKYFVEKQFPQSRTWIWHTKDNPYFPKDELEMQRQALSPRDFRLMYEIDFNTPVRSAVYDDFDDGNIEDLIPYEEETDKNRGRLERSVVIDWGWAHDMACLFIMYDKRKNVVYVHDEIVSPKLKLDQLWDRIKAKGYKIDNWYCDIAGDQEREQTGRSNMQIFREKYRVRFQARRYGVQKGIALVRAYVQNGLGQKKLLICKKKCPKLIDGMRNYKYPEKNGVITNENPVKKDDDAVDALRYFFVNRLDPDLNKPATTGLDRWGEW